ncbi:MAG: S-methyl-5-thioribose-1-phosphate isomerase, partial [Acidobacteria bacterium]|nr:S-methyl-5-thioribose-1-phosphate isomerase [Acidobacteriota bacterium]
MATHEFTPLEWREDGLALLDQTKLPAEETWLRPKRVEEVADAIRRLAVRGAPAIGVAAAYGLVVALEDAEDSEGDLDRRFERAAKLLLATRPTAVNLRWALEQGEEAWSLLRDLTRGRAIAGLLDWARALHADD